MLQKIGLKGVKVRKYIHKSLGKTILMRVLSSYSTFMVLLLYYS